MPIEDPLLLAAGGAGLTGGLLVALYRPRWVLIALLLQYSTLVWLAQGPYGPVMGAIKAMTGALAVLILGMSVRGVDPVGGNGRQSLVERPTFRAVAGLITVLAGLGLRGYGSRALPELPVELVAGGTWMLVSGLVQAGLYARPLRIGVGLLTFLSGFEIFYAQIEPSLSVAALLAAVHLGLALMTGYLIRSQGWESASLREGGQS